MSIHGIEKDTHYDTFIEQLKKARDAKPGEESPHIKNEDLVEILDEIINGETIIKQWEDIENDPSRLAEYEENISKKQKEYVDACALYTADSEERTKQGEQYVNAAAAIDGDIKELQDKFVQQTDSDPAEHAEKMKQLQEARSKILSSYQDIYPDLESKNDEQHAELKKKEKELKRMDFKTRADLLRGIRSLKPGDKAHRLVHDNTGFDYTVTIKKQLDGRYDCEVLLKSKIAGKVGEKDRTRTREGTSKRGKNSLNVIGKREIRFNLVSKNPAFIRDMQREALILEIVGAGSPTIDSLKVMGTYAEKNPEKRVEVGGEKFAVSSAIAFSLEDLLDHPDKYGLEDGLDEGQKNRMTADLLRGLQIMHSKGLVHQDLKPGNILVYGEPGDYHLKISDVGWMRRVGSNDVGATAGYQSPEQTYVHFHRDDLRGRLYKYFMANFVNVSHSIGNFMYSQAKDSHYNHYKELGINDKEVQELLKASQANDMFALGIILHQLQHANPSAILNYSELDQTLDETQGNPLIRGMLTSAPEERFDINEAIGMFVSKHADVPLPPEPKTQSEREKSIDDTLLYVMFELKEVVSTYDEDSIIVRLLRLKDPTILEEEREEIFSYFDRNILLLPEEHFEELQKKINTIRSNLSKAAKGLPSSDQLYQVDLPPPPPEPPLAEQPQRKPGPHSLVFSKSNLINPPEEVDYVKIWKDLRSEIEQLNASHLPIEDRFKVLLIQNFYQQQNIGEKPKHAKYCLEQLKEKIDGLDLIKTPEISDKMSKIRGAINPKKDLIEQSKKVLPTPSKS